MLCKPLQRWQDETNADGSGAEEVAAWRERSAAEADVAAAQAAAQRSEKVRVAAARSGSTSSVPSHTFLCSALLPFFHVHNKCCGIQLYSRLADDTHAFLALQGAATRLKAAEARLDDALELALDLQIGDVGDFDDGEINRGIFAAARAAASCSAAGPVAAIIRNTF